MNALEGIRIIEFSQAFAGPYATSLLGYLGAEVIKVESGKWPDIARLIEFNGSRPMPPEWEQSTVFNSLNLNKKSIRLNITHPKAVKIAKQLVGRCDVMMENMRAGVLEKRGLGYDVIQAVKPDIIYLSSCACGQTGPWKEFAGYAPNFAAMSGLSDLTGYADGKPSCFSSSVDMKSAYTAATAIMNALIYRQQTGQGQYIDLSSVEAMVSYCGDQFISALLTGQSPKRNGNRDDSGAPHDAYKCLGDDQWVSIAVLDDPEWQALCTAMGKPEMADDPRFNTLEARLANIDELDQAITRWTQDKTPQEAAEILQSAGVAAAPTMDAHSLAEDIHLKERGVFVKNEHPKIGSEYVTSPPWRLSETPARIKRHAPLFGENDQEIYGGLLGLSDDEIKQLEEEQVLF